MGKYKVKWCRIWDFKEEVESETEEEAYEKILEERKTAGSAIEIISVMPIDIEEVKEKGNAVQRPKTAIVKKEKNPKQGIKVETLRITIPKEKKEKK